VENLKNCERVRTKTQFRNRGAKTLSSAKWKKNKNTFKPKKMVFAQLPDLN